jgi:hypothetical protein
MQATPRRHIMQTRHAAILCRICNHAASPVTSASCKHGVVCVVLASRAEFHVSETPAGRVTDPKKLAAIKNVLALPEHTGEAHGTAEVPSTCSGLLGLCAMATRRSNSEPTSHCAVQRWMSLAVDGRGLHHARASNVCACSVLLHHGHCAVTMKGCCV